MEVKSTIQPAFSTVEEYVNAIIANAQDDTTVQNITVQNLVSIAQWVIRRSY